MRTKHDRIEAITSIFGKIEFLPFVPHPYEQVMKDDILPFHYLI